jgi:copper chaperone CopZ
LPAQDYGCQPKEKTTVQTDTFKVQPIHTSASAATLTDALKAIDAVAMVDISNPDGRTRVKYDPARASRNSIDLAVAAAGYRLVPAGACCGGCRG